MVRNLLGIYGARKYLWRNFPLYVVHQIPSQLRSSVTLWSVDSGKCLSSRLNGRFRLIPPESSHSTCFLVGHTEVDHGLCQEAQLTRKGGNHDSERASPVRYETQNVMSTPDTALHPFVLC